MSLSAGKKLMSVAWSVYEFVRDMVGEVGGVLKISKSSSSVDISQVAYPMGCEKASERLEVDCTGPAVFLNFCCVGRSPNFILHSPIKLYLKTVTQATRDVGLESKPVRVLYLVSDSINLIGPTAVTRPCVFSLGHFYDI